MKITNLLRPTSLVITGTVISPIGTFNFMGTANTSSGTITVAKTSL